MPQGTVTELKTLSCSAACFCFFVKSTDDGCGWNEFDRLGSPGSASSSKLAWRVIGQSAFDHERITKLALRGRSAGGGRTGARCDRTRCATPKPERSGALLRTARRQDPWQASRLLVALRRRVQHQHYQPEIVDVRCKAQARSPREDQRAEDQPLPIRERQTSDGEANFGRPFVPELNIDRNVQGYPGTPDHSAEAAGLASTSWST